MSIDTLTTERKPRIVILLGIRPDLIRASKVLNLLKSSDLLDTIFVWSGQHYSENLKDVFIQELGIPRPDIELNATGESDAELVASIIAKTYETLFEIKPDAAVFLGDTNTVMGSIAAAQLNIPIVHIEGCMRSYDWRMPEEKNRTVIDHIADVIYTYFDEYKEQGMLEGIQGNRIVVTQNLIVDVLNEHYTPNIEFFQQRGHTLLSDYKVDKNFILATCHRRENIDEFESLSRILKLFAALTLPIIFLAGYRTQRKLVEHSLILPENVHIKDPVGYYDMLSLMSICKAVVTDSGTVVEETAVIGIPSVQMRRSTERPQTYDCKSSVKFDPRIDEPAIVVEKLAQLQGTSWVHNFGDGNASHRIVDDLIERITNAKTISTHSREQYSIPTSRSYQPDGLDHN